MPTIAEKWRKELTTLLNNPLVVVQQSMDIESYVEVAEKRNLLETLSFFEFIKQKF